MSLAVTIALSAFNVEEYIAKSLDNIVNQTLADIEIICIDDGSTDNTLSIMKDYALQDERIKVVSLSANKGLANARNLSLQMASAKYICFVDGDDLMHTDLFKSAYELAEKQGADLVLWDYIAFYKDFELKDIEINRSLFTNLESDNKKQLLKLPAFTWTKLVKVSCARELNITFPEGLTRQDIPVHWHLITSLNNISILPKKLSYYRQQVNATTHQSDRRNFDIAKVLDITEEYLKSSGGWTYYKDSFLEAQLNMLFGMQDKVDSDLKLEGTTLIKNRLKHEQWDYIFDADKPLRWQARQYYLSLNGSKVSHLKLLLWKLVRYFYRTLRG